MPFRLTWLPRRLTRRALTYDWEEEDWTGAGGAPIRQHHFRPDARLTPPLLRSFPPTTLANRSCFPRLNELIRPIRPRGRRRGIATSVAEDAAPLPRYTATVTLPKRPTGPLVW
jgi:hypothetical protein